MGRTTEDEMVVWHHRHNEHGFGWTLGVGDGQGGLVSCGSWGRKESDTTEGLNWTEEVLVWPRDSIGSLMTKNYSKTFIIFVESTALSFKTKKKSHSIKKHEYT